MKKIFFLLIPVFFSSFNIKIISEISIEIYKAKRELYVIKNKKNIAEFKVVLGTNPAGDKMQEGDRKTPEGTFKVLDKYNHKTWRKFIWFDYPNAESYKKFKERKKRKGIDETAKIGGEIGIHGVPEGMDNVIDEKKDWTWGCVSLKNNDIDSLYNYVKKGTIIKIFR